MPRTIPRCIAHLHEENAYTKARDRAPRDPAGADLRGDQGPHQGDRPQRADAARATGGTTPARSRGSSTASTAAFRSPRPTTGNRRSTDESERDRCPASRCCSTTTSRPRATTSTRSAASTSPPTAATLLYAVDLEGDERYTIRLRARSTARDRAYADVIEGTAAGAVFDPSGRYLFYATVDESWRPDTIWRHEVGTDGIRRRLGLPRTRRAVLARRRRHPQPPVPHDRGRLERHERDLAARRRRPDRRVHRRLAAQGRRRVRRRARRRRRQGPPAHRAQRRRGELRAGQRRGIRPAGTATDAAAAQPRGAPRGRRRVPRLRRRRVPARGPAARGGREGAADRPARGCDGRRHAARARVRRGALLGRASAATPRGSSRRSASATRASSPRRPSTTCVVATGERRLRKRQPVLGDYDATRYAQRREWADRRRRHPHPDLARVPARPRRPRRAGADAALRLRLVRALDRPRVRHPAALACSTAA